MKYVPAGVPDGIETVDDVNVLAPAVSGGSGSDVRIVSLPTSVVFVPRRMRVSDVGEVVSPMLMTDDDTLTESPGAADDLLSVITPTERSTCDGCDWQLAVAVTPFESVDPKLFVARTRYVCVDPLDTAASSNDVICGEICCASA